MTDTLWMHKELPPPLDPWGPMWCCSVCRELLGPGSRVMWEAQDNDQPVSFLAVCSAACEQGVRNGVPEPNAWHTMALARFLALLLGATDTHEAVVEFYEQLAFDRFRNANQSTTLTKDSPE